MIITTLRVNPNLGRTYSPCDANRMSEKLLPLVKWQKTKRSALVVSKSKFISNDILTIFSCPRKFTFEILADEYDGFKMEIN